MPKKASTVERSYFVNALRDYLGLDPLSHTENVSPNKLRQIERKRMGTYRTRAQITADVKNRTERKRNIQKRPRGAENW